MSIIRNGITSADLDIPVVLPTLNLDFANSQKLDPRITFTRGSIGTFVNKNGLIETAQANIPRFDYDPISGECKGLLIEESRSNLVLYSEDFSNAGWGANLSSIQTNVAIAPDGTLTADRLSANNGVILNGNDSFGSVGFTPGVTTTLAHTFSIFAKAAESSIIRIRETVQVGTRIIVDLTNGSISYEAGNSAQVSASVQQYPNGWWRIILVRTPTTSLRYIIKPGNLVGNTNSGVYIWGAQLEAGAFPTSYIPTTASTVTRSAELATMTGTNFSSWFGSPTDFSVFFSGVAPNASSNSAYYWQLTNTSVTERVLFRYAGLPQVIPYFNGINVGGVFGNASQVRDIKCVGMIDNKSVALAINDGSLQYQYARLNIPRIPTTSTFSTLNIGSSYFGGNYLNGTIRKLSYYPKRILDNQAVYLTQ